MFTKNKIRNWLYPVLLPVLFQGCAHVLDDCEMNACGSCGVLEHTPGDGCTNGIWACDSSGNIECQEVEKNPCGGTENLELYGKECGNCGKYQCDGTDALKCEDPGKNACGSCGALAHAPGDG